MHKSFFVCRPVLVTSITCFAALSSMNGNAACRDILEQGIRNTYQSLKTSSFRSAVSNSFCNSNLQTVKNNSGGGLSIGIPVEGVPIELGGTYSQSDTKKLKADACSSGAGDLNDADYEKLLSAVADPGIVDAWRQCEAAAGGLQLTGKLNGSVLVLSIVFRPVAVVSNTTLLGEPAYSGVTCPKTWFDGMKVDASTRFMQCTRIGTDPVTVTVNSEYNGAMFYIPPPAQWSIVPSNAPTVPTTDSIPPPPPPPIASNKVCQSTTVQNHGCSLEGSPADGSRCSCPANQWRPGFDNGLAITPNPSSPLPAPGTAKGTLLQ